MISFRFHIISIVAVFLALAIGVVFGSTVIDQTIVDQLRNRVDDVRANLDERDEANDRLSTQVSDLEAFVEDAAAMTVDDRLTDAVTVIVTDSGVDAGPVDRTVELLDEAGAAVRGVLTIDDTWALADPETRSALAELVDVEPEEAVETIQARAASLLVTDLSSAVEVVDDGTGALDEISELQLVDFEVMDEVVVSQASDVLYVVVTGPESDVEGASHMVPFAVSAAEVSGGVVLAEAWVEQEDGPERAASLGPVLIDPDLSTVISTVDDLDLPMGPTTVVLTLIAAQAGQVGHYGVADGATQAAPPPPDDQ